MMAFPSIDAVRNLRSNRVRTARLTPPQGYGDARRRLVQRNAAQRVQQCVSQRDRWCAVAGHSRRRPAWCTLHCHSSGDSSGGESGARLQCCALLPQPSAPHSSQIFAGGGVSPRRRGSASARSSPRARKAAGCPVPSTPQTCKESAPCVPSTSGVGIARQRCDERHRQPRASDSPKGARPRATAPEHAMARS